MNKISLFIIIFLLYISADLIEIKSEENESLYILPKAKYLVEQKTKISIQQILEKKKSILNDFKTTSTNSLTFGYTKDVVWVYFSLKNLSEFKRDFYLKNVFVNFFDVYIFDKEINNLISHKKLGDLISFEKLGESRYFKLPTAILTLKPNQEVAIFLRFKSGESLIINTEIVNHKAMMEFSLKDSLFYGFFFGVIALLIIHNLFIYFVFKNRTQLYYIGYILFITLSMSIYLNYFQFLITDDNSYLKVFFSQTAVILSVYFIFRFAINLFSIKDNYFKIFVKKYYPWFLLIYFILFYIDFYLGSAFYLYVIQFMTLITIVIAFLYFHKKGNLGILFFIGSIPYWITVTIISFAWQGYIEYKNEYLYCLNASLLINFVILSFAICDKFRQVKKEKELKEKKLLKLRTNYAKDLEREVKEKTYELVKLATTDTLTQLYNRRKVNDLLHEKMENFKEEKKRFGVILFDIDRFKAINDTYGHDIGDEVLIKIAEVLKEFLGSRDDIKIGRWGGEEFVIIASVTQRTKLFAIAESLRKKIQLSDFPINGRITCSFGGSLNFGDDLNLTLKRADKSLYDAKYGGLNLVKII